ncbi:MAG: copper-binding protein [Phreatobacter sp.]|uniref:copper-binding protein n=1 Tax=Phreatobacter sp. TaxID=1966341 RepID=UPI001A545DAB|nr:copper-binding protein [Phreatobacter sp.]MBL8569472.1 copper-binding protein [Phreatobacter sp.]
MKIASTLGLAGAMLAASLSVASAQSINGEVVKIETDRGRITLKHGAIPNLDMDPMTMVFRVADPAMLQQVRQGDRVTFEASRVNGSITVTRIQRAR